MKIAGSCKTLFPDHRPTFSESWRSIRRASIDDVSPQNFNGTFTFSGGTAPQLDSNNQLVINPATGLPALVQISSIERYQRTLLLSSSGFSPTEVRLRGGGATQFSISGGDPQG